MKRIAVIGCGGAGKSCLSRELAARLGLPIIYLDTHYWQPGWVPTPMEEWVARQDDLQSGGRLVTLRDRRAVDAFLRGLA
jgi:adenylate kinase family enzyme